MAEFAEASAPRPYMKFLFEEQAVHDFEGPCFNMYSLFLPCTKGQTYSALPPVEPHLRPAMFTFLQLFRMIQVVGEVDTAHAMILARSEKLDTFRERDNSRGAKDGGSRKKPRTAAREDDEEEGDSETDVRAGPSRAPRPTAAPRTTEADDGVAENGSQRRYEVPMLQHYVDMLGPIYTDVGVSHRAIDATVYLIAVDAHKVQGTTTLTRRLGHLLLAVTHGVDNVPLTFPAAALFATEMLFSSMSDKRRVFNVLVTPFGNAPTVNSFFMDKHKRQGFYASSPMGRAFPHDELKGMTTFRLRTKFVEQYPFVSGYLKYGWELFKGTNGLFSSEITGMCLRDAKDKLGGGWKFMPGIMRLLRTDGYYTIPRSLPLRQVLLLNPVPHNIHHIMDPLAAIYLHRHMYEGTIYLKHMLEGTTVGDFLRETCLTLPSHADTTDELLAAEDSDGPGAEEDHPAPDIPNLVLNRSETILWIHPDITDHGIPSFDGRRAIPASKIMDDGEMYTSLRLGNVEIGSLYPAQVVNLLAARFFANTDKHVFEETEREFERRIHAADISRRLYAPCHRAKLKAAAALLDGTLVTSTMEVRFPASAPSVPLFDFMRGMFIFDGTVYFINPRNRKVTRMIILGSFAPRSRTNLGVEGPPGGGKSEAVNAAVEQMLAETSMETTTETMAALLNAGEPFIEPHLGTMIKDELAGMSAAVNSKHHLDPKQNDESTIMKQMTHKGAVLRRIMKLDRDSGRSVDITNVIAVINTILLTNTHAMSKHLLDDGYMDRFLTLFYPASDRTMQVVTETDLGYGGSLERLYAEAKKLRHTKSTGAYWERLKNESCRGVSERALNIFQDPNCPKAEVQAMISKVQVLACVADEIMEMWETRAQKDTRVAQLLPNMELFYAVERAFETSVERQGHTNPTNRMTKMASRIALSLSVVNELLWCFYSDTAGKSITIPHIMLLITRAVVTEDIAVFALAEVHGPTISRERAIGMAVAQYVRRHHRTPHIIYKGKQAVENLGARDRDRDRGNSDHGGPGPNSPRHTEYDRQRIFFPCVKNGSAWDTAATTMAAQVANLDLGYQMSDREIAFGLRQYAEITVTAMPGIETVTHQGKTIRISENDIRAAQAQPAMDHLVQMDDLEEKTNGRTRLTVSCIVANNGAYYTDSLKKLRSDADPSVGAGHGFFSIFNKNYLSHEMAQTRVVVFNVAGENGMGGEEVTTPGHLPAYMIIKRTEQPMPPSIRQVYDKYLLVEGTTDTYYDMPIEDAILRKKMVGIESDFKDSYKNLPFVLAPAYRMTSSYSLYPYRHAPDYTFSRLVEEYNM